MSNDAKAFLWWLAAVAGLLLLALCFRGLGEGGKAALVIPSMLLLAMVGLIWFISVPKRK